MITRERAHQLRRLIELAAISLDDETALTGIELFPAWQPDISYEVNDRYRYEDILYKCVQAHTAQANWTPDITPALWTRVSIEDWPEWIQPLGAQDAYQTGDKVSHNEKHWISTVDSNVWEPGVYGWDEVI